MKKLAAAAFVAIATVVLFCAAAVAAPPRVVASGDPIAEGHGDHADVVWLEGETPTSVPAGMGIGGAARPQFLSGGKWLLFTADAHEIERKVPAQGFTMSYPFTLADGGRRKVWARIGFEFARAPFEWRVDDGNWATLSPDALTTDLMELSFFCEVAWLKLGDVDLAPGGHTLQIRLPRYKNAKGENQRMLFALDALCIAAGEFVPHGPYRPGEAWRTEKDEQAARHVFELPKAQAAARASLKLAGLWEVCRDDEQLPGEVAAPMSDVPRHPYWGAIEVPGEKNLRTDLIFAHRVWYRTKIRVAAAEAGRSFYVVFPANNLNTTVYVNGVFCGFDKNPLARVQIDVTKGIKPGQVNELWVGIKDVYYGREADPKDPLKLRRTFNLPLDFIGHGWQAMVYPVWNQKKSGILATPEFVSAGPVYTADVFPKPSVANRQLGLEVTLANSTGQAAAGELLCEAINDKTGKVEMTAASQVFTVPAGKEQVLDFAAKWQDPKLWWPDEPNLYRLRTTVRLAGKTADVRETLFGFREWTVDGMHLRLNGIKWQGFSEMSTGGGTPEDLVTIMKNSQRNYGFVRMWPGHGGDVRFLGLEPEEFLTGMDRAGVLIRRSGYLDGEAIGYLPGILPKLAPNWYDHLAAWIKGERNHPCVMLWSIENEMAFINARNMGQLGVWEPILTRARDVVKKADPTRPMMVDGGGATRANTLPIHGDHYSTRPFWNYPQLAYEANATSPCGNWTWDEKRPKFIGEELFAAGINPAYAYFGGECVFQGKIASRAAVGKAMQIISQGYRWYGVAGCDFCQSPSDADGSQYNAWAPRAVLVRQWDWTFGSGQKATRTFGIFNNSRSSAPLSFTWTLRLDGKQVATQTTVHQVAPGENEKFDREIAFPEAAQRQEGELVLILSAAGREVFHNVKAVSVLPPVKAAGLAGLTAGELFVYDPQGSTAAILDSFGLPYTRLAALSPPPLAGKVWLVGKDALTPPESTTSAFAAYAAGGGRVLLLEQQNPLRYQGLNPAEIDAETNLGRVAFCEDLSHPILRGLKDKDFFTWEPGEVVYRNAYIKPRRGAKSLLQCNESLVNSALAVIPVGPGVITLSQLTVAEKAATNATARTLLWNLLDFSRNYRLERLPVAAAVDPGLAHVLDEINLQYAKAAGPLEALEQGKIAVVSATPAHLKTLAGNLPAVRAFTRAGGRLLLHGLAPEGLAEYNRLVGFEHMIRPFRRERVMLAAVRSPLAAGLGLTDVQLYSSKAIFNFQSGNYVASDTFSYVVDLEDVAPFATPASGFHYNLLSGMTSADGWPYICNEPAEKSVYAFTLPKPQTITSWTWVGNVFYNRTSRVSLTVDNDDARKQAFDVPEKSEAVMLELKPPMTGMVFTIRHEKYTDLPDKRHDGLPLLGCDNISLIAGRGDDFRQRVRPLLNIGALVEYPQGEGGIVLCNLLFKEHEEVAVNAVRKRTVLATLLRNMKAPFSGKTVIAGAALEYAPVDLSKHANQYRTERGWFGDKRFTFKDLPTGMQTFAGVKFNVYEFATSPVPTVVMLGASGVPNHPADQVTEIRVDRRADALFFLQAARIDRPLSDAERKQKKSVELARYVIHYADGKMADVPVCIGENVDSYRQTQPRPLPGAQIGWIGSYEATGESAVAYVQQWNNPRQDVPIRGIDLVYGKDRRGVPALLAVTAASVP